MAGFSSSSEKTLLADIRFNVGELIKYGNDPANQKFAVKIAPRQYVDAETYYPIQEGDIIQYISDSTKSSKATSTDIERVGHRSSEIMNRYRQNLLTVDFETGFLGKKQNVENADIFTMGLSSIHEDKNTGMKTLRGREFYAVDIFDKIIGNPDHASNAGYGKYATMSENVKAGYFKQFTRLAAKKNISMIGLDNMDMLINNREKLRSLLGTIGDMEVFDSDVDTEIRGIGKEIGVSRYDIKQGLGRVNQFASTLDSEMATASGNHTSPVLGAFNPMGVDDPVLKTIYGPNSGKQLSMMDIRGRQLFINSTVFPTLTDDLHVTLGPQLDDISHRLRFTDKQRKIFFENMRSGISGIYTKSTAAEDIEKNLRYALGYDSKLTHRPTSHNAIGDTVRESRIVMMQNTFIDRATKEAVRPEIHAKSVRSRFIASYIADQAMNAAAEGGISVNKTNPAWKSALMNRFNTAVDINKLSNQIQTQVERSMSFRFEKNILKKTTGQFGANTIAQLLGGAAMFAGVKMAVEKGKALFSDDKSNNTEGLRHDSIMTAVNRLARTEFGSGYLKGLAPAILKTMKAIFKNKITDPTGTPALIKNTLTNIVNTIKDVKGTQSFTQMLGDSDKLASLSHKIFHAPVGLSSTPSILEEFTTELAGKNILGERASKFVFGALDVASNLAGHYRLAVEKMARLRAGKTTSSKESWNKIVKSVSDIFVTRGKDNAVKLKAPAIALGLGGMGAIGIMLSRGSYDPDEMYKPMQNQYELKYKRDEQRKRNIGDRINDIRMSGYMEGISLGSRARQSLRYENTDFGSGYRLAMLKMNPENLTGIAKRGKNAIIQAFKGTSKKARELSIKSGRVGDEFDFTIKDTPKPITLEGIRKSKDRYLNKLSPKNRKAMNAMHNMKLRDARNSLKKVQASKSLNVNHLTTHVSEHNARTFKVEPKKLPKSTSDFQKITTSKTEQLNGAYTQRNKNLYQLHPNPTTPNQPENIITKQKPTNIQHQKITGLNSSIKMMEDSNISKMNVSNKHSKIVPDYNRNIGSAVTKSSPSMINQSGIQRDLKPIAQMPIRENTFVEGMTQVPNINSKNTVSKLLIKADALSARMSKHGKNIRDKVPHGSDGIPYIP